ncbi:hypothetical protein Aperf_G00000025244 [Anoplocephala perfoliata]
MRDTTVPNDQGSKPSSPTSLQVDVIDDQPVSSSPEHAGYTLLVNTAASSESSDDDEQEDGSDEQDLNDIPLDDARIDEALRLALNSDGANFGSFKVSAEAKDIPDESSPALLWSEPRKEKDRRIPLPEEKAAEIKACLKGFQLPEANMPLWAKQIPEEVWKQRLLQRIPPQPAASETRPT